jgi:mono/diheme cytochrome c family protein
MRATNRLNLLKPGLLTGSGLVVIAAAVYTVFCPFVYADGDSKSEKVTKEKTGTVASAEQQKLTGQQLYAINCNRCHSERYPTEWTPAHWRTVMMHMRVRANLPAEQAKEILKYLEQDAGN